MSSSKFIKTGLPGILIFSAVAMFLTRCSDSVVNPDTIDLGYGYFPLDTGYYREYFVRKVRFSSSEADTSYWYYRYVQKYWFSDQGGDSVLVIERYKRSDTASVWEIDSLIRVKRNTRKIIVTENNTPYVKLVFPVKDSLQWNGNAYNTLTGQDDYYYINAGKPYAVPDTTFNNTITVIEQEIDDPIVNQVKNDEIYANGVGLIFREKIDYHFCQDQDCLGQGIIDFGTDFRQWILKYGYE